ncbi:hypothetical protein ACFOZ7_18105 [Natribaculum luteum]|uniref:DUF7978 domain-containing protein n=1 Tax=Natribaculum luteum TaxID=1586232 RepID=A0ABD5P443_9EURY|nr:hypothetical protein [Natribaculum luteum]
MSARSHSSDGRAIPFVAGAVAGIVTWLLGYAFTYVIVAPDVRESGLHRAVEAFDGEPATYEMVGWVFYNAHFVDTVFRNVPLVGSITTTYVGGEEGFTLLLHAVPAGLLFVAGLALATYRGVASVSDGALAGLATVPGYLLLSAAGAFLFEVTVGGASGAPDAVPAVVLAGLVFPAIFAGGGGAVAAVTADRDRRVSEEARS